MAPKKTQEESEQPAKVYQLDALADQVAVLSEQMKEGFKTINANVSALLVKTDSQVTPQQLADNIAVVDKKLTSQIDEEVKKIHLEYKPVKDTNKWLWRAIATQGIVIVGQLLFLLYATKGA